MPAGSLPAKPSIGLSSRTKRSISGGMRGSASPCSFCPTRSAAVTRSPAAGRNDDGSIQRSCADAAAATSRARMMADRMQRRAEARPTYGPRYPPDCVTPLLFVLLVAAISFIAGVLGSLLGLGGGMIVVPALTLLLGVDIRLAIGASIISVIATSSGAAAAYVRDHLANLRVAMFLELGTTAGALTGASIAGILNPRFLFILFGLILGYSAFAMLRGRRRSEEEEV